MTIWCGNSTSWDGGKNAVRFDLTSYMSTDVTYLGLFEYMTNGDANDYQNRTPQHFHSGWTWILIDFIKLLRYWSVVSLQDLLALYDWNVLCAPVLWCSLMTLTWFINKRGMYLLISHTMSLMYSSFFCKLCRCILSHHMGVSENNGTPKSSIFHGGFSLINNPFWGTTIFGNPHMRTQKWTELHTCSPNVRLEVEG